MSDTSENSVRPRYYNTVNFPSKWYTRLSDRAENNPAKINNEYPFGKHGADICIYTCTSNSFIIAVWLKNFCVESRLSCFFCLSCKSIKNDLCKSFFLLVWLEGYKSVKYSSRTQTTKRQHHYSRLMMKKWWCQLEATWRIEVEVGSEGKLHFFICATQRNFRYKKGKERK